MFIKKQGLYLFLFNILTLFQIQSPPPILQHIFHSKCSSCSKLIKHDTLFFLEDKSFELLSKLYGELTEFCLETNKRFDALDNRFIKMFKEGL